MMPDAWKEAIVIPVLKSGTARSQETCYRPINLTRCLWETMEGMVNSHLIWVLENRYLISGAQRVFRRHRSSLDHLVNLEYHRQNALLLRQYPVAVFSKWRRLKTPLDGMVFSEPYTAGILRDVYHCFFLTSLKPDIFTTGLGMFCLHFIPKKMDYKKERSSSLPCLQSPSTVW
jgi:hypothetical protein